ncbi:MAG: type II toxin-antitoxin system prevent-host-death family antitoxin [Gammaproteobacteria bacterium]|uniref:type II toxin-antitoxin system prevent-host-death family antitoxin n=1 Tax=Rhodoferax sp. TaxID=50421 RepID=UPI0017CAC14D|nr:type II toxin-antitoxin system prevent-host-death family antitoxin [Rhodoferax sp.]MBU3900553.1 type II toxin-antitoxin system prevent-host-death family antitoxin [Gammaproteobacteria bacterium]MBA3057542.1 type II toxin-antitoxin system prevent-host-death family antitoxin [Rhodoferax sp.]MBU3996458.1 type II toxin-antitoxin system prevent-host-death family antitoxin [Gammaproteobacteria bacterium]MBU4079998.1 type II toxin-antitoxin system prevent-host-death family antitoxin [Gammaproteobac
MNRQPLQSQAAAPTWRLQDAKSQFSALVDQAMRGVPQHVTRRGKQAVVVVSEHDFEALQRSATSPSPRAANLIEHLLAIPKEPNQLSKQAADGIGLDVHPREIDFS